MKNFTKRKKGKCAIHPLGTCFTFKAFNVNNKNKGVTNSQSEKSSKSENSYLVTNSHILLTHHKTKKSTQLKEDKSEIAHIKDHIQINVGNGEAVNKPFGLRVKQPRILLYYQYSF